MPLLAIDKSVETERKAEVQALLTSCLKRPRSLLPHPKNSALHLGKSINTLQNRMIGEEITAYVLRDQRAIKRDR